MHPVERARLERGMTRTELAAVSGVDRHTVGAIEAGRRAQARTVARLARALGLRVEDVVGEGSECDRAG